VRALTSRIEEDGDVHEALMWLVGAFGLWS